MVSDASVAFTSLTIFVSGVVCCNLGECKPCDVLGCACFMYYSLDSNPLTLTVEINLITCVIHLFVTQ